MKRSARIFEKFSVSKNVGQKKLKQIVCREKCAETLHSSYNIETKMTMDDDDFELQINVDDFEQVNVELCRCCLSGSDPLNEIFRCVKLDGELLPISNVYRNVTDLSVSLRFSHLNPLKMADF